MYQCSKVARHQHLQKSHQTSTVIRAKKPDCAVKHAADKWSRTTQTSDQKSSLCDVWCVFSCHITNPREADMHYCTIQTLRPVTSMMSSTRTKPGRHCKLALRQVATEQRKVDESAVNTSQMVPCCELAACM
jgi:hypothetical protein